MTITRTNFPQYQVITGSSGGLLAWTQKRCTARPPKWGPPLRPEIPKISLERFRKTRGFTLAAARPNAAVAHTVFGLMATAMAVRPLGQLLRADVSSAPAGFLRGRSVLRVRVLVDGFALVREAGVILRTKSVGPLLRCFGWAGFFTPLQKVLKQLLRLLVSSRLARR